MTAPYMGHQQTFSVSGTSTYGFCTLAKRATHLERQGIRGTRSHDVDDVVEGPYTVNGQISLNPSNTELAALDVRAIGAGGTVAETLSEFAVLVDKGADVYTYANCKVNRMTLSGRQGELINLTLDVEGLTESATGSSPAEPSSATPFWFDDVVLTIGGTAYEVEAFELVVDNALLTDRFQMNESRADLPEGDRMVTLRTEHSYSSNTSGLHTVAIAGSTGTLVLNDGGGNSRTYSFGKLQAPNDGPEVASKGPIPLVKNFVARKDGATKEIAAS